MWAVTAANETWLATLRGRGDLHKQLNQHRAELETSNSEIAPRAFDPRFEDKIARIRGEPDHPIATGKEYSLDDST